MITARIALCVGLLWATGVRGHRPQDGDRLGSAGTALAVGIHAAAWTALALTPLAVWHAIQVARQGAGEWRLGGRAWLLAVAAVILGACSLYWRIAGTTLELG